MRIFRYKRLLAAVAVVLGIVAIALWPESIEVSAAQVGRGPLQVTLDEDGETRVRDRFVVSAPVAGRLQRIELEPGDRVVRGKTVVARLSTADAPLLDPRTRVELQAATEAARAAVGQAQAQRDRARAELSRARTTVERQRQLMKAGAIASDTLDAAETALATAEDAAKAAEFAVSRAEYELQLSRARLQAPAPAGRSVDVVAPVDGVILKRLRESESVVPVGEPLIEIGDPSRIEIVADFLSTDAVQIQPGAHVLIEGWGGSQPLHGTVRRVEPAGFMKVSALGVEEQRVNVLIDFTDPPAERRLGDGFRVEVRVVIWSEPDVVKVPVGGLFRRGDAWAAFLIEGEQVRLRTVRLGQRNAIEAQILEGLMPGEAVVLHPPDMLTDGARVTMRSS
jgi:HlyD family secretion protein